MTGPRRYPPADATSQWFAPAYPGAISPRIDKLVVHTTEGSGWPTYSGGAVAPNFTGWPNLSARRILWRQHFPVDMASRALVHSRPQATNADRVVQVELVGTCVPRGPGLYWPTAPEWALSALADLIGWLRDNWGLPAASSVNWRPYAAAGDGQRLTDAQWDAYRGVLGHQHAPQNDHRDPGNLDMARVLSLVHSPGGSDVALTDDDIARLAASPALRAAVTAAVWQCSWGGERQGGTTERADWRLWRASYPPDIDIDVLAAAVVDKLADRLTAAVVAAISERKA